MNIAPGRVEVPGGEVEEVGRGQAEVGDVDPLGPHAVGEGAGQLDAGLAHVAGHQDLGRAGEAGHGAPDGAAHVRIELVGHGAAHVVGLEDLVHAAHGAPTIGAPARGPDGRPVRRGRLSGRIDAPTERDGQDGHQVEGGVGHHVHAEAPGAIRDGGQHDAEDGQAGELDPLAVGEAEEEPVDDHRQDDSGGTGAAGRTAAA